MRALFPLLLCATWVAQTAAAAPAAGPRRRFAVIVGANDGGTGRTLRHAVSDARGFAAVMTTLGGVSQEDRMLLEDPAPSALRASLAAVAGQVAAARAEGRALDLVFYYSGHSDEEGLLLRGDHVPYAELRQLLQGVPADFRITVLDSCASGSFTRAKGGAAIPAFLVDRSSEVKGDAVLTSSTATEVSQESDRLGSSFFTHHLLSGLRGAADVSHDGRVTLNEVYQFAFNETLARTERTRAGAQHPAYDMAVAGTGDVVLTDVRNTDATLLIPETVVGHLFLRNAQGALVVELRKAGAGSVQLALEPGGYDVTLVQGSTVLGGTVTVRPGGVPALVEIQGLRTLPAEANPLRGEAAEAMTGVKLWHGEVRLFNGLDLSGAPDAGFPATILGLGASYFIRPLRDDRVTPFSLLRFFQRPDELAVTVSGLGIGNGAVFFDPQIDLAGTVYPWSSFGLSGGVGFSKGRGSAELGFRVRAGMSFLPTHNVRLSATYLGARSQNGDLAGLLPAETISIGTTNADHLLASVRWVIGYDWTLEAAYEAQWSGVANNDIPSSRGVAHLALLGVTHHFGRHVSFGASFAAGTFKVFPVRTGAFGGPDARSYQLLVLPHVEWFINDFLTLTVALGPSIVFADAGAPASPSAGVQGAGTLGFSARF